MLKQIEISLPKFNRGYHLISHIIIDKIKDLLPDKGIINIFMKHTSAAITINENADPSVRDDFESFMSKLIPENDSCFTHIFEGADDMPAHIKASLIGCSLQIPITGGRLNLGTWQGIYLCEFRDFGGKRKLVISVFS